MPAAIIVPTDKDSDYSSTNNYQPISLLSMLIKLLQVEAVLMVVQKQLIFHCIIQCIGYMYMYINISVSFSLLGLSWV